MGERSVLASFYSQEEAQHAATQIKQLGIEVASVDELHAYGGVAPAKRSFPLSGEIPSLASLTENAAVSSRDAGVLLAASPAASGMSGSDDASTGRNYLLTVVCPNQQVQQVVQMIKNCHGYT